MDTGLQSLIACGTKVWLDSIDPDLIRTYRPLGITGATSNPIIITDLIKTGRFDDQIAGLCAQGADDADIAWHMTDHLVSAAQEVFRPVWERTQGNDGYVSFELDPLLEDPRSGPPHEERVRRYIELGQRWAAGQRNRMIKVPATAAGLDALEALAAAGVTLNVTLCFTRRQYEQAREAIWRGAQRRADLDHFKSVYSIFVSRVDGYTQKHVPNLSPAAQGLVGIVNAQEIWRLNQEFWRDRGLKLQQEIIFASTGTKRPQDPPDLYVAALAGSDIQTNPPATNAAVEASGKTYTARLTELPPPAVVEEIRRKVDMRKLEATLMSEGVEKFAQPQQALLQLIARKRLTLAAGSRQRVA